MTIAEILAKALGDNITKEQSSSIASSINGEIKDAIDKEVKGLKENQTKNLDQIAKLKTSQLPDDFDTDNFTKYLKEKDEFTKKQKELEDKELEDKGQWEALKQQLVDKNAETLLALTTDKDGQISGLRSALDKELIENASIKAIEKEKGNSFFLLPHMKNNIKTVLEDGAYVVQVLDGEGKQRLDDDGKSFSVAQLVAEMKTNDQFAPAFPESNSGSGKNANTGSGGGSTVNPWKADSKNVTAQARMNKENPVLAEQMRKAAGVA